YLEKTDDVIGPVGLQYPLYGLSRPVVEPVYDTRNSGDVVIGLAKKLGKTVSAAFPWKDYEAAVKERAKGLFEAGGGLTGYDDASPVWKGLSKRPSGKPDYKTFDEMWKNIQSGGLWYRPIHSFKNWDGLFKTPSGKFEFCCQGIEAAVNDLARNRSQKAALETLGIRVSGDEALMPHFAAADSSGVEKPYPLLLMPYALINLSSGPFPNPPYLNKTLFDSQLRKDDSFVQIHPETASKYGLKQGDRVTIQSPKGDARARADLFDGAMPGVLYAPLGFGHGAYDDFQRGKGFNPNALIDSGADTISGHMVWWNTRVRIAKV
ncbi:MAG: molybdopterin dinucleotide binding domain-containing protein, partial [Pseudomonadota bacterium]